MYACTHAYTPVSMHAYVHGYMSSRISTADLAAHADAQPIYMHTHTLSHMPVHTRMHMPTVSSYCTVVDIHVVEPQALASALSEYHRINV